MDSGGKTSQLLENPFPWLVRLSTPKKQHLSPGRLFYRLVSGEKCGLYFRDTGRNLTGELQKGR